MQISKGKVRKREKIKFTGSETENTVRGKGFQLPVNFIKKRVEENIN